MIKEKLSKFPIGEENKAFGKYFTGKSYLAPLNKEGISIANVTFSPSCRNAWHIHHAKTGGGQILIVIYGKGIYVEEGKEPKLLKEGDVVYIKPNVKHWHGATKDSYFQHLALEVPGTETSTERLDKVDDDYYLSINL